MFTLVITDFGIAKVIGGKFNVLATDVYKQVIGQQNFAMGAVVGMVLLVPAVLAFVVDRMVQRKQVALLSARAVPLRAEARRAARPRASRPTARVVGGLIARDARHGGLGLVRHLLALQPLADAQATTTSATVDADGWGSYFNSLADGGAAPRCSAPRSSSPAPT